MKDLIEQDGEFYVATGEVRKPKRGEWFSSQPDKWLLMYDVDAEATREYQVYHELDKQTVKFVLDYKPEGVSLTLREYLRNSSKDMTPYAHDPYLRQWATYMLDALERLEK
jgi:hypothetical protein